MPRPSGATAERADGGARTMAPDPRSLGGGQAEDHPAVAVLASGHLHALASGSKQPWAGRDQAWQLGVHRKRGPAGEVVGPGEDRRGARRHSVCGRRANVKLGVLFRRMAHSPGPTCPRCGSLAPDGLVLKAGGGAVCLPCSILLSLGQQELAVSSPQVARRGLASRRADAAARPARRCLDQPASRGPH